MYVTNFLNYKCFSKTADIGLVRGTSQGFICILNRINWLIFKMRVIKVPFPKGNIMEMNISDYFFFIPPKRTKSIIYKSSKSVQ